MARPSFGYRNAAGKKVPGSTTVLKSVSFMDTDILCNWAAKLARQGQDWKAARSAAGDHGTKLHELCEVRLPHELVESDRPEGVSQIDWMKLKQSYEAIRKWWVKHGASVAFAEEPLVSELYQFGGTPDAVVRFENPPINWSADDLYLLDFKTGGFIGAKEVAQMSSYRQLLAEVRGLDVKGCALIHAPTKEPGYMRPVYLPGPVLDMGWTAFTAGLAVASVAGKLAEACE